MLVGRHFLSNGSRDLSWLIATSVAPLATSGSDVAYGIIIGTNTDVIAATGAIGSSNFYATFSLTNATLTQAYIHTGSANFRIAISNVNGKAFASGITGVYVDNSTFLADIVPYPNTTILNVISTAATSTSSFTTLTTTTSFWSLTTSSISLSSSSSSY